MASWPLSLDNITTKIRLLTLGLGRQLTLNHVLIFLVGWTFTNYYCGQTRRLSHIPSMGWELPFLSFLSSIRFTTRGREVVLEGKKRYGLFKFPEFTSWMVLAADRSLMEEIRKAPEHLLSGAEFTADFLQVPYSFPLSTLKSTYQIPVIRNTLTKSIPLLVPEIYTQLKDAFANAIPTGNDWISVPMQDATMQIVARVSGFTFVGKELSQNKEYIALNVKYSNEAIKLALVLRSIPSFLKPLVFYCISSIPQLQKRNREILFPLIEARRRAMKEKGDEYEGKPQDILSWFIDAAQGEQATSHNLAMMMHLLNFGAIHTTSMTFIHAAYYAAATPAYVNLLRDEIQDVVGRLGWTKEALDEMTVVDSFIKECQRMHANGSANMARVALEDYTFSNGVTVPKGTVVAAAIAVTHFDEDVYPDPYTFDPLRFAKLEASSSPDPTTGRKRFDITAVSLDSLIFGYGRHACPGRFFAASEMKLMLAYMVMNYDMKFQKEGVRPADISVGLASMPNPFAKVLFRKRQT